MITIPHVIIGWIKFAMHQFVNANQVISMMGLNYVNVILILIH